MRQCSKPVDTTYVISEEAVIDLNNLLSEMSMGNVADEVIMNKTIAIAAQVDKAGIRNAAITEKEAFIYAQLLKYELALTKFDELMKMEQASFYVSTLEIFCNTKAKKAVHEFVNGNIKVKEAAVLMDKVIAELKNLLYISPTAERFNLLGSTHKRRAYIATTVHQKSAILGEAAYNYQQAQQIAGEENSIYSLTNWYILESVLIMMGVRKWGSVIGTGQSKYELPSLKEVLETMAQQKKQLLNNNNFSYTYDYQISLVNILLCELLVQPQKADQHRYDELLLSYRTTWAKVGSTAKKAGEIEHLDIISSALSFSTNKDVVKLKKGITALNNSLKKMLVNG